MVGTVGALKSHPSSHDLSQALAILQAVGKDKTKQKILEEIKEAQDQHDEVLTQSRLATSEAHKAQLDAQAIIDRANIAKADAEEALSKLHQESHTALTNLEQRQHQIAGQERAHQTRVSKFEATVQTEQAEFDKRSRDMDSRDVVLANREVECAEMKQQLQARLEEFTLIQASIEQAQAAGRHSLEG